MSGRQKIRKGILLFAFFLFPVIFFYFSPYLVVHATIKNVINGSFVVFAMLFLSSLFLGRAFCGWVCSAGGVQETIIPVNSNRISRGKTVKWIIWLSWVSIIAILAFRVGGYKSADFFYMTKFGLSVSNVRSFITYLLVLLLVVIPAFIAGRRSFCHHICWMAPFMITGRKIRNVLRLPSLRLSSDASKCVHCHICTRDCPMSLPVEEMVESNKMENSDCILCGNCADVCKMKVFKYEFNRKK